MTERGELAAHVVEIEELRARVAKLEAEVERLLTLPRAKRRK